MFPLGACALPFRTAAIESDEDSEMIKLFYIPLRTEETRKPRVATFGIYEFTCYTDVFKCFENSDTKSTNFSAVRHSTLPFILLRLYRSGTCTLRFSLPSQQKEPPNTGFQRKKTQNCRKAACKANSDDRIRIVRKYQEGKIHFFRASEKVGPVDPLLRFSVTNAAHSRENISYSRFSQLHRAHKLRFTHLLSATTLSAKNKAIFTRPKEESITMFRVSHKCTIWRLL